MEFQVKERKKGESCDKILSPPSDQTSLLKKALANSPPLDQKQKSKLKP